MIGNQLMSSDTMKKSSEEEERAPLRPKKGTTTSDTDHASSLAPNPSCTGAVRSLLDMLEQDEDSFSRHTTTVRLKRASLASFTAWLFGTLLVLLCSSPASYSRVSGIEREVATMAFVLMLLSNISRFLPLLYRDRVINKGSDGPSFFANGFFVTSMTVQGIAMVANGLMAFFPTPVVIDPVTGARVYLVRWCEWVPLCFLLTFLSEEIDTPTPRNRRTGLMHALAQGGAALAGFWCPFISNERIWWTVIACCVVLYSSIFVRLHHKQQLAQKMRASLALEGIMQYDKVEEYSRLRLCVRSLGELAVMWTTLVILHFVASFLPRYLPPDSLLNTPALPMVAETFSEVLSKHLHILVLESVSTAFSEKARSDRMLQLLRRMMGVVWERSSDAIAISVTSSSRRLCIVSPAIFDLMAEKSVAKKLVPSGEPVALVFEVPLGSFFDESSGKASSARPFSKLYYIRLKHEGQGTVSEQVHPIPVSPALMPNIRDVANLVEEAVRNPEDAVTLTKDIASKTRSGETAEATIVRQCEVSVRKIESSTVVMVFRDISERVKRYEIQKQLAIASTEREKDSQTNRFTRHEVKNGLLSAIGLIDGLKDGDTGANDGGVDSSNDSGFGSPPSLQNDKSSPSPSSSSSNDCPNVAALPLQELESTLHEILDTVMSQAMTRDVTHEVYTPREEQVDIHTILRTTGREESRFPSTYTPEPFPEFRLDHQLLQFIHRNAISNACKYGRLGGIVNTNVSYDSKAKILNFDVVNEPGENHEELVQLGEKASREMFLPGRRLHSRYGLSEARDSREVLVSSGDGAWIMRKCARMLGGDVSITFNPERTIFNLSIPAKECSFASEEDEESDASWEIPTPTWAVVIDDSKVQRKLLDRMLDFLGIEKDRRTVLGATTEEMLNFNDIVKELVESHGECKFLIIADENLDIVEGATRHHTLSGSLCIERLLRDLHPKDERRVLALVRSANDSREDLELYTARSHGFLIKEPIRRENVSSKIRPFWVKRFDNLGRSDDAVESPMRNKRSINCRLSNPSSIENAGGGGGLSSVTTTADLTQIVDIIDDLILYNQTDWPPIRDKFQVLKGDMMTLINRSNPRVVAVVEALEELRMEEEVPSDLDTRWKLIRALIMSLI